MKIRTLARHELGDLWSIDRAEVIDWLYRCVDGALVFGPVHYDVPGWPPGTAERTGPSLLDRFNRGGTLFGAFEGGALVGAAVLESRFIEPAKGRAPLFFGRADERGGVLDAPVRG